MLLQGALTGQEVVLITSILQAANGMLKSGTGSYQSYSQSFGSSDLQDMVGRLTARALSGLEDVDYDRHFRDMVNRLEHAFFPEQSVEEQMNDMMDKYSLPHVREEPDALKVR